MGFVAASVAPLAIALIASACSSGKQTLGYELGAERDAAVPSADGGAGDFSADVHLPWFGGPAYHARWPNGLPPSVSYVPIGVWMQSPDNAERYRAVGVNLFIGLWEGPTDEQLDALPAPAVSTFCGQSGVWESRLDDRAISGWMHDESPDNAQEQPDGSYGPCIEPGVMQEHYAQMVRRDPSRPVLLLLGQGVADAEWPGRGSCSGRDEMYPEYARAGDVLGYYSYPLARGRPLELIATGADNLLQWSGRQKPVIALVEASSIDGAPRPTPEQLRAEVWLALVRGAAGIAYYCHRFMPDFSEIDCLENSATRSALARINAEITGLAPALNSPMVGNGVTVDADVPIATRLTRVSGVTYLFAVSLAPEPTHALFQLRGLAGRASAVAIGEDRTLELDGGQLADDFSGHGVRLYRIER
ncbi:MAG TPA: hypothetical protein VK509_19090 [Polyangiales bacterium]|nr:hypothetical protein [Polyangiales bacterium]